MLSPIKSLEICNFELQMTGSAGLEDIAVTLERNVLAIQRKGIKVSPEKLCEISKMVRDFDKSIGKSEKCHYLMILTDNLRKCILTNEICAQEYIVCLEQGLKDKIEIVNDGELGESVRSDIYRCQISKVEVHAECLCLTVADASKHRREISKLALEIYQDQLAHYLVREPRELNEVVLTLEKWGASWHEINALLSKKINNVSTLTAAFVEQENNLVNQVRERGLHTSFPEILKENLQIWRQGWIDKSYTVLSNFFDGKSNYQSVQSFQKELSDSFRKWIDENIVAVPWACYRRWDQKMYAACALGSLSRDEGSILSDCELVILCDLKDHADCMKHYDMMDLTALSLLEDINERPFNKFTIERDSRINGFYIEKLDFCGGKYLPIGEPSHFINFLKTAHWGDEKQLLSLLSIRSLYASSPDLIVDYHDQVNEYFADDRLRKETVTKLLTLIGNPKWDPERPWKDTCYMPLVAAIQLFCLYVNNPFQGKSQYSGSNLGFGNTIDLVDQHKLFFSGPTLNLIKEALAGLYLMKLQEEIQVYRKCEGPTAAQILWAEKMFNKIIRPLSRCLQIENLYLLDKPVDLVMLSIEWGFVDPVTQAKEIAFDYLKYDKSLILSYKKLSKSIFNEHLRKAIYDHVPSAHPLKIQLQGIRNIDGWSRSLENEKMQLDT